MNWTPVSPTNHFLGTLLGLDDDTSLLTTFVQLRRK